MPLQKKCILVMVFVLAAILCACAEIADMTCSYTSAGTVLSFVLKISPV